MKKNPWVQAPQIPQVQSLLNTITPVNFSRGSGIAKKRLDLLEQQYRDAFAGSMFMTSTKMNNQIKGQEGYKAQNKTADQQREAIKNMKQFGWLYKG